MNNVSHFRSSKPGPAFKALAILITIYLIAFVLEYSFVLCAVGFSYLTVTMIMFWEPAIKVVLKFFWHECGQGIYYASFNAMAYLYINPEDSFWCYCYG